MIKTNTKTIVAVAVAFALVFASLFAHLIFAGTKTDKTLIFFVSRISIWVALLLIFLYAKYIEKANFLLWQESSFSFTDYIKAALLVMLRLFALLIIAGIIVHFTGYKPQSAELEKLILLFKNNSALLIFTCITAGITEELIFRGYMIPRLATIFKNTNAAIIFSSVLFGLLHYGYGTIMQIVGPLIIGLVLGFHYKTYTNIRILIFCHFLWDFLLIMIKT